MGLNRRIFALGIMALLTMGPILILTCPGFSGEQQLAFTASDQVSIGAVLHQGDVLPKERLIIVAPGFAQHSGTRSMRTLAMALTATADVLVVDFRGNGRSQGVFTFGSREYLDLEPVFKWSSRYADVTLLGFSLGAYHSLCAVHAFHGYVRRLLLVSCPTRVEDVVLSGGAFLNPLALLFRRTEFQYPPEDDLFFRWGWPFSGKADCSQLATELKVPCCFLTGGRDTLVFERLTRKVFEAVPDAKTYTRMEQGLHAEAMFMQFPDEFLSWVQASLKP